MRIFGPSGVRAFPTDRNATLVFQGSGRTTSPGGTTTNLASYTVPAGRRALLSCHIAGCPTIALAAGQTAELTVFVDPAAAVESGHARGVFAGGAAVNTERSVNVPTLALFAGDLVRINANVAAGAGSIDSGGGIEGVEYDA